MCELRRVFHIKDLRSLRVENAWMYCNGRTKNKRGRRTTAMIVALHCCWLVLMILVFSELLDYTSRSNQFTRPIFHMCVRIAFFLVYHSI